MTRPKPKPYRHDHFGTPAAQARLEERRLPLDPAVHRTVFVVWTAGAATPFAFYPTRDAAEAEAETAAAARPGRSVCVFTAKLTTRFETGPAPVVRIEEAP